MQPSAEFVVPETLGFESSSEGWWKMVGERKLLFTRLRSRLDLEKTEQLQRTVFGVSDRDLASSSILVAVHETGGEVLGAFDGERLHLALALHNAATVEMGGPIMLAEDVSGLRAYYEHDRVTVPDGPGLGVVPDETVLKRYAGERDWITV